MSTPTLSNEQGKHRAIAAAQAVKDSTHTPPPGPWTVCTEELSEGFVTVLVDPTGQRIAECYGPFQQANARLIAQAPAMLEALKQILIWAENGHSARMTQNRSTQKSNADRLNLIVREVRNTLAHLEKVR